MQLQTIQNDKLKVAVSPCAAELKSIKDNDGNEYLWQGDPAYWEKQAINLFPYIGRFTDGCYTFNGKRYEMDRHGFLPKTEMSVESSSASSVCFFLKESPETLKVYPFEFELRIRYTLNDSKIEVSFEVTNTGEERMFFGIGGHPGFNVPLENGLNFDDYYLEFAEKCDPLLIGLSEACLLSGTDTKYPLKDGRIIPLHHALFDNDAIILKDMSKKVSLKTDKGSRAVTVSYPEMTYIGFWHIVKSDAPFVCIEPWTSLPSRDGIVENLATQPGLVSLNSGETYINPWSIEIH